MKSLNPEVIRALTPILLATIGGAIGVAVLVTDMTDAKWAAGLGLAGTAIAGAAGLAQTSKTEPNFSVEQEGERLQIETPADDK